MDQRQLSRLREELERKISGGVLFDEVSRLIYSTDASLYQMKPLGVVLPRTRQELVQAVRTAAKYRVPILPRGGGTSLAGQTVTAGIVIDSSKYLNRILEVNAEERWARVEPGVVLDNLNHALAPRGLFFAPDVATSSRATIGGMIGNNSAGVRSVRYGKTVDHVLGLSVVLADGEQLEFSERSSDELQDLMARRGREGELYRRIREIVSGNRDEIRDRYPRVMRRVGGYNLDYLLDNEPFNLAKLVVGSEGTLALVTEARINLEPVPAEKMVCVVHFSSLVSAIDAVEVILRHRPTAVEIIDEWGLRLAKDNPVVAKLASQFVQGDPKAVLIVEFAGSSRSSLLDSVQGMKDDAGLGQLSYSVYEGWEDAQQAVVWEVRKNALGVLLSMRGDAKPLPFIEDASIPVEHLSTYIREVLELCRQHDRPVAMYAHASVGVIHVRPILNLKRPEDVAIMQAISEQTFRLVRRYQGSWSGEHGDGLVRSYKNREFFGERLYGAFQEVKATFDPHGLFNPGKIVDSPAMTEHLRIHPGYKARLPKTFFQFAHDGGFDMAVEMCTGVGQCRKTLTGTMCPSYMATRDEEHSTRGRANALRSAMAGELGEEGLTSPRLYEVMDLCLECKACKSECPSSVDMARLKAEFLAHYSRRHGLPLGKRLFASIRRSAALASRFPRLANVISGNRISRVVLEWIAGIESQRPLPRFSKRTLERSWAGKAPGQNGGPRVALFADTFINYFEPEVGLDARRVLEAVGCRVDLIGSFCCGRPLISAGRLKQARRQGSRTLERLAQLAQQGVPLIVLEPSCLSTIRDDLPDLVGDESLGKVASNSVFSLEEFLGSQRADQLAAVLRGSSNSILFHAHCQQKALMGTKPTLDVLRAIPGAQIEEIDSGCCGMAGSFGYESRHYALSEKIGDRRLFPAVRQASPQTVFLASGFSCRAQIEHFTGKKARHLAQILASQLGSEDSG